MPNFSSRLFKPIFARLRFIGASAKWPEAEVAYQRAHALYDKRAQQEGRPLEFTV